MADKAKKHEKKIRFIRAAILNCEFSFKTHHLLRIFASLQNLRKNFHCKKIQKKSKNLLGPYYKLKATITFATLGTYTYDFAE